MVREDSIGERARNKKKILNKEASHPYFWMDSVLIQTPPEKNSNSKEFKLQRKEKKSNYTPGELPASDL